MNYWFVTVLREGESPPAKLGAPYKPVLATTLILVEADSVEWAMERGREFAEECEPCTSVRWKAFTALSASSVQLPMVIANDWDLRPKGEQK